MNKLVQAVSFASSPCRPLAGPGQVALTLAAAVLLSSCKDQAKESAAHAVQNAADMAALVDRDLGEVERGMPEGAKRLAPLVAAGADPHQDVTGVRRALGRVRRDVVDLSIAKSTFFALADASGIAIRNDLEEDVMAGQNLFAVFPALARAKDGYVTTTGLFPNASTRNGPDRDWIAGVPVKRENGATGAVFVTGWTYRFFARHLQESLKDQLTEQAKKSGDELKMPVFYVAIFDGTGVYSAPLTPPVDEKALSDENLVGKTAASSSAQGTLTITDRAFGWAATRTPRLAADTGVVVLRSEF
jgi:hypothetical protein